MKVYLFRRVLAVIPVMVIVATVAIYGLTAVPVAMLLVAWHRAVLGPGRPAGLKRAAAA